VLQTCEEQIYCLIGSCGENIKRSWTEWLDELSPYAINFLAVGASWELSAATAHQLVGLARERESLFYYFLADSARRWKTCRAVSREPRAETIPVRLKGKLTLSFKGISNSFVTFLP